MTLRSAGLRRLSSIRTFSVAAGAAVSLTLAGCVGFSSDGGMAPVAAVASSRLDKDVVKIGLDDEAAQVQARVAGLLKRPLRVDSAVQIAFLRNRQLQADFNGLGISEAEYVRASLPPDLVLSADFLAGQGDVEIVGQVVAQIYALATLPARQGIAAELFAATQARTAGRVMSLAAEVSRQYYVTVAAQEQVAFLEEALATAKASAEIARQLGEAGNLNKLEQARQDVFYTELGAQRADARLQAQAERERLTRLMGLWGHDIAFTLPKAMPTLPKRIASAQNIETRAVRERLDLAAARHDLDALAHNLGLTRATRYVTDFSLIAQHDTERASPTSTGSNLARNGFVADIAIPIYDFGESKVRGAREAYLGAANRLAQQAINARSEAREAYIRYRGKYDLARYYAERVLPLRKTILDETTLQYNGMLVDVTQLLIDARGRIASNIAFIAAKRDFFIGGVNLKAALIGIGPGQTAPDARATPSATEAAN